MEGGRQSVHGLIAGKQDRVVQDHCAVGGTLAVDELPRLSAAAAAAAGKAAKAGMQGSSLGLHSCQQVLARRPRLE